MNIRNVIFSKIALAIALTVAIALGIAYWRWESGSGAEQKYRTAQAKIGNVTQTVSANGTLNPVILVNVGTQVSGTVKKLQVDFNDQVKAGQVLLELDPALLESQVKQSEANLASARASLELATANEARARSLFQQEYISKQDYDTAVQASKSGSAQVDQANAQLAKDRTNLAYTVIRSPVSGVVVSRAVDLGQTVAASFQTPTLFQIAQDLRKMQIYSSFAEADIGNIKVGQPVQFSVDAFPDRSFNASVGQIRLNAVTQQNVVTYNVVVAVANPDEILLPGMTAYVSIIIAQRKDVLTVPSAALRFRPEESGERSAQRGPQEGKAEGAGVAPAPKGSAEISVRRRPPDGGQEQPRTTVYVVEGARLRPVQIQPGISDGRLTEVIAGELKAGDAVAVGAAVNASSSTRTQGTFRMRLF